VIEIRNLTFQPLTLQLAGGKGGLHLGPRQRKPIPDSQLSAEIRTAAKRGFVTATALVLPGQPDSAVATSVDASIPPVDGDTAESQSKKRR